MGDGDYDPLGWKAELDRLIGRLPDPMMQQQVRAAVERGLRGTTETLRVQPIPIAQVAPVGACTNWIWDGYIAAGGYTLLLGLWKSGKSTLLAHLLKALADGTEFCGRTVTLTKVLVISEEASVTWAERRDALALGNNIYLICRPFLGKPTRKIWEEFIAKVAEWAKMENCGLVAIDPIQSFLPICDENSSGEMMTALLPLQQIAETGAGVLLLHHPSKSDATEGRASRGSGALPGFADIVIEMRRYDPERLDAKRVLKAYSRFDETPSELVIELTEAGYIALGTKADVSQRERITILLDLLNDGPQTLQQIQAGWPEQIKPSRRSLERDLARLITEGQIERLGDGTRGDPFRYRILRGDVAIRTLACVEMNLNDQNAFLRRNICAKTCAETKLGAENSFLRSSEGYTGDCAQKSEDDVWDWLPPSSEWTCLNCGRPLTNGRRYYCERCGNA